MYQIINRSGYLQQTSPINSNRVCVATLRLGINKIKTTKQNSCQFHTVKKKEMHQKGQQFPLMSSNVVKTAQTANVSLLTLENQRADFSSVIQGLELSPYVRGFLLRNMMNKVGKTVI